MRVGLAKQLGLLLLGNDYYLKLAMVNEGGSLDGMFSYLANAAARGRNSPKKDIEVVDGVFCNRLDPSLSPGGRASKAIWTTRGDGEYTLNAGEGWAELATGGRGVFIGRKRSPRHQISVLLDPDINPSDEDEVTWAVMTRAQPAADFHFKGGNITIDARKPGIAERRASLPPEVVASVRRKVSASLRPS